MTREQALRRLGSAIADALAERFEAVAEDAFRLDDVVAVPEGDDPLAGIAPPALLASARSTEEAVGGSVLVLSVTGARELAGALTGEGRREGDDAADVPERERDVLGPVLEEGIARATTALGVLLGEQLGTSRPALRVAPVLDDALPELGRAGQACRVDFTLLGAPACFVQVLPHAAIVRMTGAHDDRPAPGAPGVPLGQVLRRVDIRVWAELGRARMATSRASDLPLGAVVELDRAAEEPIDLYADGMRFAQGRLVVDDDGALSVRIEALVDEADPT